MRLWKRHVDLVAELIEYVPKHHLMFHLIQRAHVFGNPWMYTTFLDESYNKTLKAVLRNCHQAAFEPMAFAKLDNALARAAKRHR